MKKIFKKEEGFTIIEVVLVLAIAGLIFLVVFLALPQLQKSRRDTQRRNDASRIAAAMESYAGNSNGKYPTTPDQLESFVDTYIVGQNFDDPSTGKIYGYNQAPTGAPVPTASYLIFSGEDTAVVNAEAGAWKYYTNATCTDNGATAEAAAPATPELRSIAIRMSLEQGQYCVDNQ